MSAEVRRYGGTVTSVMGDAIMAVFLRSGGARG